MDSLSCSLPSRMLPKLTTRLPIKQDFGHAGLVTRASEMVTLALDKANFKL